MCTFHIYTKMPEPTVSLIILWLHEPSEGSCIENFCYIAAYQRMICLTSIVEQDITQETILESAWWDEQLNG
jgi:hypothetical protein